MRDLEPGPQVPLSSGKPAEQRWPPMVLGVFFGLLAISWAAPTAYGGSQARGLIGAVAASLCQSQSNVGSEPRLAPTPQLTAMPDP